MSKSIKIIIAVAVVAVLSVGLAACVKPQAIDGLNNLGTTNYTKYTQAKGLDSVQMLTDALSYLDKNKAYAYEVQFQFGTDINVAQQASYEYVKVDADKVLHEQIIVGSGLGKINFASLRYHDKKIGKGIANDPKGKDAEKRVPGFSIKDNKDLFAYDLSGIAPILITGNVPDLEYAKDFANYSDYLLDRATKYFWLYNYAADDLSEAHSTKVYTKDKYYYCDITLDTINCIKEKNQPDVVTNIQESIKMKLTEFKHDTVLRMRLEAVGDTFRLVDTRLEEGYKAIVTGASQTFQRKYYYTADKYTITNVESSMFD